VFSHFERKEDLLLDRLPDAVDIVRAAVRERAADTSPVEALHQVALALAAERHPLSGLIGDVEPFSRTLIWAVESVQRRLAGGDLADIAAMHRERLNEAFDAVAHGLSR
jgi:hypothetical protein